MSELEELEIRPRPTPRPGEPEAGGPESSGPGKKKGGAAVWAAVFFFIVLVAAAIWWFWLRGGEEAPPQQPPVAEREAPEIPEAPPPQPPEELELPPLAASDDVVRDLVGRLSGHPRLVAWLGGDELVHRFVATVDNVAQGVSPRPHLEAAVPEEGFSVVERDGETWIDPESYRRYDTAAAVFTSFDPATAAGLYRRLEPLFDEAYRQLGYPTADFDDTLTRAFARLLATPVVEGEVRLTTQGLGWGYADPRLEALTPAQKNLLRTGPANTRRIQGQLRALATALGLPAEALPRTPLWRSEAEG